MKRDEQRRSRQRGGARSPHALKDPRGAYGDRASHDKRGASEGHTAERRERAFEDDAAGPISGERHSSVEQRSLVEQQRDAIRPLHSGSMLYGLSPVLEALRARRRPIEHLTLAEGARDHRLRELLDLARAARVPVRRVPRADLERLTGGANHQGVVAVIAAARYADAGQLLDTLAQRAGTDEPPLVLVLDGVEDPRNLGALVRTVECAGAHGVFIPERRAVGLTETVAKAAAGALEHVPVARAANLNRLIDELKERNIWTIGTSADAETPYTSWDWTQPSALVLGGEGAGLHRLVRERCDVLVSIPLRGHLSSLNVSVAAGILLYEAVRQRTLTQRSS